MRIAGVALSVGAAGSFIMACAVPDDSGDAIASIEPAPVQAVAAEADLLKPESVKPELPALEFAEAAMEQS